MLSWALAQVCLLHRAAHWCLQFYALLQQCVLPVAIQLVCLLIMLQQAVPYSATTSTLYCAAQVPISRAP